jgi:hypothetical protein
VLALLGVLVLAACGGASSSVLGTVSLSGDTLHAGTRRPTVPLELRYTLNRPARVSIGVRPNAAPGDAVEALSAPMNRAPGAYYLRLDGAVPLATTSTGPTPTQIVRVLPDGPYTLVLEAAPTDGSPAQTWTQPFTMTGVPAQPPVLENVQAHPDTISPNSDAVDDVASITFRTAQTSTTTVTVLGAGGQRVPVLAATPLPAGEHNYTFTGTDLFGQVLPDGPYTATVRTADPAGNAVEARVPITITGGGTPSIALLAAEFSPHAIMQGKTITVRMTVQNTGKVPLRTQGPDPGYTYTTNDTYSSIEGGQFVDKAGLWRVAVDWDGNAGGGPLRYPFRWGFGHTLAPGETVRIEGHITILKYERTMWFFTGLLQEGVRIVQDRLAPTAIDVGF